MTKLSINAEYVRLAHGFASTEETRFYLMGVQVEPHPSGEGVLIIATDGHVAGIFYDRKGIADKNYLLALDKPTLSALKAQRSDGNRGNRFVTIKDDRLVITNMAGLEYHIKPNAVEIDGTFPDWRRIIPEKFEGEASLAIDANGLKPFIAVAKSLVGNSGMACVTLTPGAVGGPNSCRVAHPDFTGVITPARGGRTEPTVDWI